LLGNCGKAGQVLVLKQTNVNTEQKGKKKVTPNTKNNNGNDSKISQNKGNLGKVN